MDFSPGVWCGIELDETEGKHDGHVANRRYFRCRANHGIFAPVAKVQRLQLDNNNVSSSSSSGKITQTSKTKLKPRGIPQLHGRSRSNSPSASSRSVSSQESLSHAKVQTNKRRSLGTFKQVAKPNGLIKPNTTGTGSQSVAAANPGRVISKSNRAQLNATFDKNATFNQQDKASDEIVVTSPPKKVAPNKAKNSTFDKSSRVKAPRNATFEVDNAANAVDLTSSGGETKLRNSTFTRSRRPNSTFEVSASGGDMKSSSTSAIGRFHPQQQLLKRRSHNTPANSASAPDSSSNLTRGDSCASVDSHQQQQQHVGGDVIGRSTRQQQQQLATGDSCDSGSCSEPQQLFEYIVLQKCKGVMSEVMTTSQISHASSLGILDDCQMDDDNLLTTNFCNNDKSTHNNRRGRQRVAGKRNRKHGEFDAAATAMQIDDDACDDDERQIDEAISGLSTPDMEVSSGTSSSGLKAILLLLVVRITLCNYQQLDKCRIIYAQIFCTFIID